MEQPLVVLFRMSRRRIFDAIATERSTASSRMCSTARSVCIWICRSACLTRASASARAFTFISSAKRAASARVRETISPASTRASDSRLADLGLHLLQFLLRRRASSSDLRMTSCRCSSASSSGRHANRASRPSRTRNVSDGPDVEPGIGLDQRVVHRPPSTSSRRSAARRLRRESRRLREGTTAG